MIINLHSFNLKNAGFLPFLGNLATGNAGPQRLLKHETKRFVFVRLLGGVI